jgi:lipopolysaccharide heptosyltransferase II
VRILVVRAGALGDTLMATPVVTALREKFPGSSVDFLASAAAAPLLQGVPEIHEVLTLHRRNVPYWLSFEKMGLASRLRAARYDRAIVLEHAARYYELIARARVPNISGFRETRFDPALHSIANNLRAAGIEDLAERNWRMLITPVERDWSAVREIRRQHSGPVVGLHVGYGPPGRKKNQEQRLRGWPLENFAALGAWLIEHGAVLLLNGAPEDRETVDRLVPLLPRDRVLNFTGRLTLRDSVQLIRNLDLLVSVDSGPAHIAAAVGTPLVVLWGPGILDQTRPIENGGPVDVLREAVPCAPCYGTPLMKSCRENICMQRITPARVIAVVENRLKARPSLRPPA